MGDICEGLEVCICEDEGSVPVLRRGDRVEVVRRVVHDILLFFSPFFGICSCQGKVGDGTTLWVMPTAGGGNGEIELELRVAEWEGKGKENGKVYCPEASRPSIFLVCVPFASASAD